MSTWLTRFACLALALGVARADELDDVRARQKIEAQRAEADFHAGRAAAYKLVRTDPSRLRDAVEQLNGLLTAVRGDTALERSKRDLFLVTLRADLQRVRDLADASRPAARPVVSAPPDRRPALPRTEDAGKGRVDDLAKMLEARRGGVVDSRLAKLDNAERRGRTIASVEESAIPESADATFPKNWKELSEKRSSAVKMTDMEKAIMKSLSTPIAVEYSGEKFQDVLDHLRKVTGLPISADKRSLEEAGVTYETPINLKLRSTSRTVLKKLLGELNLAYIIKDETVLILSRERAAAATVTKAYYLGDLVGVVGVNLDPITSQLVMLERVNGIIQLLQNKVDPNSWRSNNPDAAGAITFYPPTMSLIVKQTAEWHFMNAGK